MCKLCSFNEGEDNGVFQPSEHSAYTVKREWIAGHKVLGHAQLSCGVIRMAVVAVKGALWPCDGPRNCRGLWRAAPSVVL